MVDYSRRQVLLGAGSIAGAVGLAGVGRRLVRPDHAGGESTPLALARRETETPYPLVTYNDHDGVYRPTMPVNVRFDLADTGHGADAVEAVLRDAPGWTRLVSVVDAVLPVEGVDKPGTWDGETEAIRPPSVSYRRLVSPLGPTVGYHVHAWPVRVDGDLVGVAGSAHTDVGTARDHLGARYDEAADRLSAPFLAAGWRLEPAEFDFGVDAAQRDHWGPTGDRWLRPPPVA